MPPIATDSHESFWTSLMPLGLKLPKVNTGSSRRLYRHSVSCGDQQTTEDNYDTISLDETYAPNPTDTFFVHASGNSMIGAGIHDGDMLIIDSSLSPKHGDIVLAAIGNEYLVKRFITDNNTIILRPENSDYSDLVITDDHDFTVVGIVCHSVRSFR